MRGTLKLAASSAVLGLVCGNANAVLIDHFTDDQEAQLEAASVNAADAGVLTTTSTGTVGQGPNASASDLNGATRIFTVTRDNDDSPITITSPFNGSQLQYNKGADNNASGTLDYTGGPLAGGFDFTMNGEDAFLLEIFENSIPQIVSIMIGDGAATDTIAFSGAAVSDGTTLGCTALNSLAAGQIGNIASGSGGSTCYIPYDEFMGVDLTAVTSVSLLVNDVQANGGALVLEQLATGNFAADPVDPNPVPAPAGLFLVAAGLLGMRRFRK